MRERLQAARTRATDITGAVQDLVYSQGLDFMPEKRGKRMLKLGGFSPLTRRLIYLSYALLAVMAFWLILLLLAETAGALNRPPSPAAALAVFVAFTLAWGLLLTGALYTRRSIRIGANFLYLIVTAIWVVSFTGFIPVYSGKPALLLFSALLVLVGAVLLLTVPVFFFVRRRAQPSPVKDFVILSLLICATYGTVYVQLVMIPDFIGDQFWINISSITLYPLLALIELLFVILGLDIVELLYRSTGLATVIAGSHLRRRLLGALVVLLLACQLGLGVWDHARDAGKNPLWEVVGGDVAALSFVVVGFVAWWLLQRYWGSEPLTVDQMFEVAKKWALLIIAIFWGIGVIIIFVIVGASLILPFVSGEFIVGSGQVLNNRFTTIFGVWFFVTAALAIVMGIWAARRGHRAVALYLAILGGSTVLFLSITAIDLKAGWSATGSWWAIVFGLVGLRWLRRGRLTDERLRRLFLLALITLGIYGLGKFYVPAATSSDAGTIGWTFVVFTSLGLVWDLLTMGYWANGDSSGLPQVSRLFLYLGFVIVCITALDWSVMALGSTEIKSITQITAPFGLIFLGRPLIYATFIITLALPATSTEAEDSSMSASSESPGNDQVSK